MIDDERTYGFTGERSRWIRWEFAILVVFGLAYVAMSLNSLLQYGPIRYSIQLYDVWYPAAIIAVLIWIAWMSGDSLEMFGISKLHLRDLGWLAMALAISVPLFLGPYSSLAHQSEKTWLGPSYALSEFQINRSLIALPLYLLPAAFEEIFYRGLLQTRAQEITGSKWGAIGGSAALFAMAHLYQGPQALPWILAFGLVFSFLRSRGCPLWPLVAAHTIYNAVWSGFELVLAGP